jgi:hypothetical protein
MNEHTAVELEALASELRPRDEAFATLFRRLADAVRGGRTEEARAYAQVVDARTAAELLEDRRPAIWGVLELARNVLVFAPIAVTWYGLSIATDAYAKLLIERPDLVGQPFLALWQGSFGGAPGVFTFSTLALVDAALIALLIGLSLLVHFRSDVRDPATRTRALLRESRIRTLLAAAASGPVRAGVDAAADALLDQLVAEEQRVYERASERERELADLGKAVGDLRRAAADLARAAEDLRGRERIGG